MSESDQERNYLKQMVGIKSERDNLKRTNQYYVKQVSQMEVKISELKAMLQAKDSEIQYYKNKLLHLEEENSRAMTDTMEMSSRSIQELESKLVMLEEENEHLKSLTNNSDILDLKVQLEHALLMKDTFEGKYREARHELLKNEALDESNRSLQEKPKLQKETQVFQENSKLKQELQHLKQELQELKNSNNELSQQNSQLQQKHTQVTKEKENLAKDKNRLSEEFSQLERQLEEVTQEKLHSEAKLLELKKDSVFFQPEHMEKQNYFRQTEPSFEEFETFHRPKTQRSGEFYSTSSTPSQKKAAFPNMQIPQQSPTRPRMLKDLKKSSTSSLSSYNQTSANKPVDFVPSFMRAKKPMHKNHVIDLDGSGPDSFADDFPDEDELA